MCALQALENCGDCHTDLSELLCCKVLLVDQGNVEGAQRVKIEEKRLTPDGLLQSGLVVVDRCGPLLYHAHAHCARWAQALRPKVGALQILCANDLHAQQCFWRTLPGHDAAVWRA